MRVYQGQKWPAAKLPTDAEVDGALESAVAAASAEPSDGEDFEDPFFASISAVLNGDDRDPAPPPEVASTYRIFFNFQPWRLEPFVESASTSQDPAPPTTPTPLG